MNGQLYQSSGRIVLPGNRDEPARRLGSARMIALLDRATALPECNLQCWQWLCTATIHHPRTGPQSDIELHRQLAGRPRIRRSSFVFMCGDERRRLPGLHGWRRQNIEHVVSGAHQSSHPGCGKQVFEHSLSVPLFIRDQLLISAFRGCGRRLGSRQHPLGRGRGAGQQNGYHGGRTGRPVST
jgi:hypothetical protein